jgi:hypothetical protein
MKMDIFIYPSPKGRTSPKKVLQKFDSVKTITYLCETNVPRVCDSREILKLVGLLFGIVLLKY